MPIKRGVWQIQLLAEAAGWPGVAGVVVLASVLAVRSLAILPVHDRIAEVRRDAEDLRQRTASRLRAETLALDPAEQLVEFYRFFPIEQTIPDAIARIHLAATQNNLSLESGEYHLSRDSGGRLARYEILLPLRGGYAQVRKFIAQTLAEAPNLSLDALTIGRQKAGDPLVDAQIRFTLYLLAE